MYYLPTDTGKFRVSEAVSACPVVLRASRFPMNTFPLSGFPHKNTRKRFESPCLAMNEERGGGGGGGEGRNLI